MQPVVHFELPADDIDRAIRFYDDVFGWVTDTVPVDGDIYTGVITTAAGAQNGPGGIDGAIVDRDEIHEASVITIEVPDIEAHADRIEAAGGTMVSTRASVPELGYAAYFEDTEGTVLGLWEPLES